MNRRAFTLVELLVVIAILGLVAALLVAGIKVAPTATQPQQPPTAAVTPLPCTAILYIKDQADTAFWRSVECNYARTYGDWVDYITTDHKYHTARAEYCDIEWLEGGLPARGQDIDVAQRHQIELLLIDLQDRMAAMEKREAEESVAAEADVVPRNE